MVYECVQCDKSYKTKKNYDQHIISNLHNLMVNNVQIPVCTLCNVKINGTLTQHERGLKHQLEFAKSESKSCSSCEKYRTKDIEVLDFNNFFNPEFKAKIIDTELEKIDRIINNEMIIVDDIIHKLPKDLIKDSSGFYKYWNKFV